MLALFAAALSFFRTQSEMLKGLGHVSSGQFTQAVSLLATTVIGIACILMIIAG